MNDSTEKELLEEMRAWWNENGRFVITGLVLGIAIIFGWNQWRTSITTSRVEASILFEQVMDAVQSGDIGLADGAANDWFGWSVALAGNTALMGDTILSLSDGFESI